MKSILFLALTLPLAAQSSAPPDSVMVSMARNIQREILSLSEFGLFDDIRYQIKGEEVVLSGFASRPILKDSAERVVKRVAGVKTVTNRIEVLPASPQDERIRAGVYVAVYGHQALRRYDPNRGAPIFRSRASQALGISTDPPPGYHPIHIIVKNGNVALTGVVDNEGDRAIAGIQANLVPGVFDVENDLRMVQEAKPRKR